VTSLIPATEHAFIDSLARILALGELPIVLWLLIVGAREAPVPAVHAAARADA
jgi:hypothetical protein